MSILPLMMKVIQMTNHTFDYDEFMSSANRAFLHHCENLRYGQFLMNYLKQHHPDILVPDDADCFYNNDKVPNFMRYIFTLSQSESQ